MLPSPIFIELLHIYSSTVGRSLWPQSPRVCSVSTTVPLLPALLCVLPRCSRDLQLQLLPLHRVCRHRVTEVRPQPALPLGLGTIRALMDNVGAGSATGRTGALQGRQERLWSKAELKAAPGVPDSCQRREKETDQ